MMRALDWRWFNGWRVWAVLACLNLGFAIALVIGGRPWWGSAVSALYCLVIALEVRGRIQAEREYDDLAQQVVNSARATRDGEPWTITMPRLPR